MSKVTLKDYIDLVGSDAAIKTITSVGSTKTTGYSEYMGKAAPIIHAINELANPSPAPNYRTVAEGDGYDTILDAFKAIYRGVLHNPFTNEDELLHRFIRIGKMELKVIPFDFCSHVPIEKWYEVVNHVCGDTGMFKEVKPYLHLSLVNQSEQFRRTLAVRLLNYYDKYCKSIAEDGTHTFDSLGDAFDHILWYYKGRNASGGLLGRIIEEIAEIVVEDHLKQNYTLEDALSSTQQVIGDTSELKGIPYAEFSGGPRYTRVDMVSSVFETVSSYSVNRAIAKAAAHRANEKTSKYLFYFGAFTEAFVTFCHDIGQTSVDYKDVDSMCRSIITEAEEVGILSPGRYAPNLQWGDISGLYLRVVRKHPVLSQIPSEDLNRFRWYPVGQSSETPKAPWNFMVSFLTSSVRYYKHPFIAQDDFGIMAKVEKLSEEGPTEVYLHELAFLRDELGLHDDEIDDLMSRIVNHAEETQAISPGTSPNWKHFSASVDYYFSKVFPFNQVPFAYLDADTITIKGTRPVSTCIAQLAANAYYNKHKRNPSK